MFNIGESRTISHPSDTELQAQQVAANPRRGRFSAETPLEITHRRTDRRRQLRSREIIA